MGIFMRFNQDSIQKSTEVRCVCCTLNLSLYKCWSMVFLRYETPVEFHGFALYAELSSSWASCILALWRRDLRGWNFKKIFHHRFSVALTTPKMAIPILKPSEGSSLKSVIMSIRLIMLEMPQILARDGYFSINKMQPSFLEKCSHLFNYEIIWFQLPIIIWC